MAQEVQTTLMFGGLDLVTPAIAIAPGKVISAINYEPDVNGYSSFGGYECYDGHPRPSATDDPVLAEERRSQIGPVPGIGPVRGVWVYGLGGVYAFRDQDAVSSAMFKASSGGWVRQAFGSELRFSGGTAEFLEGEYVTGATSSAVAIIDRVVMNEGAWDGSAAGYLVVSDITGSFVAGENLTSTSGAAVGQVAVPITIPSGGRYDFTNHNFYGAMKSPCMYFVNGVSTGYEWNGSVLTPIHTGTVPTIGTIDYLLSSEATGSEKILSSTETGEEPIVTSSTFDSPTFISHFKNHLFLGYPSGSVLNSSLGEPLEYITTTGASEITFGDTLTGMITAAATSLMFFGQNRIEYLIGDDSSNFELKPIADSAGAKAYTVQLGDMPLFLDDAGVRKADSSSAFGDWRMGTLTQPIEPLIVQKRDSQVMPVASLRIKAKDQYRLFWEDGTGITTYLGRKAPETLPFNLPIRVSCACAGEVYPGRGDFLFVGAEDGFVYELNRGTSFNGAPIESYIRLPFTPAKSPAQNIRWMKATFELSAPDEIVLGLAFDVDYARGLGGAPVDIEVENGSPIISTEKYENIDWRVPVEGRIEHHVSGIGPNIATTLIHSSAVARQHTISSLTYNFSRRGLRR